MEMEQRTNYGIRGKLNGVRIGEGVVFVNGEKCRSKCRGAGVIRSDILDG